MLAFGVAVSEPETYESFARPGIQGVLEADSIVLTRVGYDSIQEPYNELLEEAAAHSDLEALVLLHQDVELTDGSLPSRIRRHLHDGAVGIVGALGVRGPRFARAGRAGFRTRVLTRRPRRDSAAGRGVNPLRGHGHSEEPEEVELIDGVLMALAPWVVRTVRFDQRLARRFHCYDLDFSLRVRAAGGRLICDPIPHVHHMVRPWRDRDDLMRARMEFARRWDPELRPPEWAPAFEL